MRIRFGHLLGVPFFAYVCLVKHTLVKLRKWFLKVFIFAGRGCAKCCPHRAVWGSF